MTATTSSTADQSTSPDRGGLVLLGLILVAAVANLNLAVANVALPDIGKAFDASQTALNLVAVGYSLGLAASVLYLGALGDRYGRKLMLILGVAISVPACILAATAPNIEVLIGARILGGRGGRHGIPDNTRAHHRAVVGSGAHTIDCPLVRAGRCHLVARATGRGWLTREVLLGIRLLGDVAARGRGAGDGGRLRPWPCERDHRSGRQLRRHLVGRDGRQPHPRDQLRAGTRQGNARVGPRDHHDRSSSRVRHPATSGQGSAVRPPCSGSPHVLGRSLRRHHRVRHA